MEEAGVVEAPCEAKRTDTHTSKCEPWLFAEVLEEGLKTHFYFSPDKGGPDSWVSSYKVKCRWSNSPSQGTCLGCGFGPHQVA